MDELKQAYETLGLPEDATREQVEQRYFVLMKKERSQRSREDEGDGGASGRSLNLEEINRAYNRILGVESEKESPVEKQGKAAYFFYYYKFHVIISLIILIVLFVTVKGAVDRRNEEAAKPPLDLSVTVYGNFFGGDAGKLSENLLKKVPEWKRIDVLLTYVPIEVKSQQDMALQQKAMLTMMTEKMDLLILDAKNFDLLANQGAFAPLDNLSVWPELKQKPDRILSVLAKEQTASHPYGVDITGSGIFAGTGVQTAGEKLILAIRAEPAHQAQALKMFGLLASATP